MQRFTYLRKYQTINRRNPLLYFVKKAIDINFIFRKKMIKKFEKKNIFVQKKPLRLSKNIILEYQSLNFISWLYPNKKHYFIKY